MFREPHTVKERITSLAFVLLIAAALKVWDKMQTRARVEDTRASLLYQSRDDTWLTKWRNRIKAEHA